MCQGEFTLTSNWKNPVENGVLFFSCWKDKDCFFNNTLLAGIHWDSYAASGIVNWFNLSFKNSGFVCQKPECSYPLNEQLPFYAISKIFRGSTLEKSEIHRYMYHYFSCSISRSEKPVAI